MTCRTRLAGFALALGALALSGCTTVTVVPSRMDAVKTIAIVGFSDDVNLRTQNEPSGGVGGMVTAIKDVSQLASGELEKKQADEANGFLDSLAGKLEKKLGVKVKPRDEVAANVDYAKLVTATALPHAVFGQLKAPGILTQRAASDLAPADRDALCKSLGVDALVIVYASHGVGKTTGAMFGSMGKLTKYPQATVRVSLYDAANPEPAWKDIGATGACASVGVENVMGAQIYANEAQALQESSDSALDVLLTRYDEAKAKALAAPPAKDEQKSAPAPAKAEEKKDEGAAPAPAKAEEKKDEGAAPAK